MGTSNNLSFSLEYALILPVPRYGILPALHPIKGHAVDKQRSHDSNPNMRNSK